MLCDLSINDAKLVLANAILTERLTVAREKITDRIAAINKTIHDQRVALEAWALAGGVCGEKRSVDMLHGTVGFRLGPQGLALKARETWEDVLARLKGKFKKYVRVKSEVDRRALLKDVLADKKPISTAELSKLGLKLEQTESFFVNFKKQ